jgi:hypothetical protein
MRVELFGPELCIHHFGSIVVEEGEKCAPGFEPENSQACQPAVPQTGEVDSVAQHRSLRLGTRQDASSSRAKEAHREGWGNFDIIIHKQKGRGGDQIVVNRYASMNSQVICLVLDRLNHHGGGTGGEVLVRFCGRKLSHGTPPSVPP